mmetsp:Transcript_3421/g.21400  ORF Transcript_3421/g.21400 Transcript_3421/m.21400 type:complete len:270 (-) Transcript_3421:4184-4993(-)
MIARTSERPWAAPLRSTALVSLFMVSKSQGTSSVNFSSPNPFISDPSDFAAIARMSGLGSITIFCSSGSINGTYGARSFGSFTKPDIRPIILAAFFFVSVLRSLIPRLTTGTSKAKEGASTLFMKTVPSMVSRHAALCFAGLSNARIMDGTSCCTSGFWMTLPICCNAVLAAACTFGCDEPRTSDSLGTTVGKQDDNCFGAQKAIAPSICTLPTCVLQAGSSNPVRRLGMTNFTPCADRFLMTALAAWSVASLTGTELSLKQLSIMGRM